MSQTSRKVEVGMRRPGTSEQGQNEMCPVKPYRPGTSSAPASKYLTSKLSPRPSRWMRSRPSTIDSQSSSAVRRRSASPVLSPTVDGRTSEHESPPPACNIPGRGAWLTRTASASPIMQTGTGVRGLLSISSHRACKTLASSALAESPDATWGVTRIISALSEDCLDAQMVARACVALSSLADVSAANQTKILDRGGIEQLAAAMRTHEREEAVQLWALVALQNILHQNARSKSEIAAQNGIELVVNAMDLHKESSSVHLAACQVLLGLSSESSLHARIKAAGAGRRVKFAMDNHSDEGQIMTTGQAILTRLSGFEPVIKVDAAKNTFVVSDGCNLIRNSSMKMLVNLKDKQFAKAERQSAIAKASLDQDLRDLTRSLEIEKKTAKGKEMQDLMDKSRLIFRLEGAQKLNESLMAKLKKEKAEVEKSRDEAQTASADLYTSLQNERLQLEMERLQVLMYKKEIAAMKAAAEADLEQLQHNATLIQSLQSDAQQDPVNLMTDKQKWESLQRLLKEPAISKSHRCEALHTLITDEEIVEFEAYSKAVVSGLTAQPPGGKKGCPSEVKRKIISNELTDILKKDETSAVSLIAQLLSSTTSETSDVTCFKLLEECILKDVCLSPMEEQASFVKFLGTHWMTTFESVRASVEKIAHEFVADCPDYESQKHISREQVVKVLKRLGVDHPETTATSFLSSAVGDNLLSLRLKAKALFGEGPQDESHPHHACVSVHTEITIDDVRRAIGVGRPYHHLVQSDSRKFALNSIIRQSIDYELGGFGVGSFISAENRRDDDRMHGYAGTMEVMADVLQVERSDLVLELARMMPGEVMSLSKQDPGHAGKHRHSMIRYATSMISNERIALLAWRGEVEVCKQERAEEEAAALAELARQAKMKPVLKDMSIYEGGKPTAIKTLGNQIANVYQKKIKSDETRGAWNRFSMVDYVKQHFILQYGLKSVALKNLANLAAGIRQEHTKAHNVRLRVFGKLSGVLEPENYQEGRCSMVVEGVRALFPGKTESICSRIENQPRFTHHEIFKASLAALNSKYYYPRQNEVMDFNGEIQLHPLFVRKIMDLADDEDNINVDEWMELLVSVYDDSRADAHRYFSDLYVEFDKNHDGTLDMNEFTAMIHAVDPSKNDQAIMEMYTTCLDITGEEDQISASVWVFVALQNHLPVPSHKVSCPSAPSATEVLTRASSGASLNAPPGVVTRGSSSASLNTSTGVLARGSSSASLNTSTGVLARGTSSASLNPSTGVFTRSSSSASLNPSRAAGGHRT